MSTILPPCLIWVTERSLESWTLLPAWYFFGGFPAIDHPPLRPTICTISQCCLEPSSHRHGTQESRQRSRWRLHEFCLSSPLHLGAMIWGLRLTRSVTFAGGRG
jgi:hypothetical protein